MNLTKAYLTKLIKEEIEKKIDQSKKGGTHTFHGNSWPAEKVGSELAGRGPRFEDDVAVTKSDIEKAEDWLEKYDPEELIAYSRGSAVFHKLIAQNPNIDIPDEITYVAPAAKRDKWGAKNIDAPSVSGKVISSAGDGAVPLKQACDIADEAGIDMFVTPGEFKSDDWELEGRKNHIRVLKYKDASSPGVKINPSACANSPDLPDKGSGFLSKDELKQQVQAAARLAGKNITPKNLGLPDKK